MSAGEGLINPPPRNQEGFWDHPLWHWGGSDQPSSVHPREGPDYPRPGGNLEGLLRKHLGLLGAMHVPWQLPWSGGYHTALRGGCLSSHVEEDRGKKRYLP